MPIDLSSISIPTNGNAETDPVIIFQNNKSRISDPNINDLWLGQGDALREWHQNRTNKDNAIVLNTGAGKTLIGLLIAQSLSNETGGHILYACGSIQLIEQTAEKAAGYGMETTTYHGGSFNNDLFDQGVAPCLTTYQALFNGKSIFQRREIDAIIFDDSHTAENVIKDHFSLNINIQLFPAGYAGLIALFQSHFHNIGRNATYEELTNGRNHFVELLPPNEANKYKNNILEIIINNSIHEEDSNKFSWEYLKDRLDLCAILVSNGNIQIIPPFIPTNTLNLFNGETRRVYLTATMLASDSFIRTFGKPPDHTIHPTTPAGECERLMLFPGKKFGYSSDTDIRVTKSIILNRKTLILCANRYGTQKWEDIGSCPDRTSITATIGAFKAAQDMRKIILTGRYDGIDLPGDTCRNLVLSGLPAGSNLLDKYFWNCLKLTNVLRSTIASRIIQSLGRISRGMSDFGIVLINEKNYDDWISITKNRTSLPAFIQKQVLLGQEVTKSAKNTDDLNDICDKFIERNSEWSNFYSNFMKNCDIPTVLPPNADLEQLAISEVKFGKHIWNRDYAAAVKTLSPCIDTAFTANTGLGSWYSLWTAFALELAGDPSAEHLYKRSYGATKTIPNCSYSNAGDSQGEFDTQIHNVSNEFIIGNVSTLELPINITTNLNLLNSSNSVPQIEEGLRYLGQYIGFDSTRPDKEHSTGPDVLWILNKQAIVIEAKTAKEVRSQYTKDNLGQLRDHIQWVKDNHNVESIVPLFIGPIVKCSDSANPSDDILVANLNEFIELKSKTFAAYQSIVDTKLPIMIFENSLDIFKTNGLLWNFILSNIQHNKLIEIH